MGGVPQCFSEASGPEVDLTLPTTDCTTALQSSGKSKWGLSKQGLEVLVHNLSMVHEDGNGEKLTVKKWWIFGADFFTVWCRFFHGLRRFFTVCKGHKR